MERRDIGLAANDVKIETNSESFRKRSNDVAAPS